MGAFQVKIDGRGLLDYVKAGREAVREVQKTTRKLMGKGRQEARRRISSEFAVRTGTLRGKARKMQTKAMVSAGEVKGVVSPIPMLMNIFERGATLARGRGFLRPRPVIHPARVVLEKDAPEAFNDILQKVGR